MGFGVNLYNNETVAVKKSITSRGRMFVIVDTTYSSHDRINDIIITGHSNIDILPKSGIYMVARLQLVLRIT